MHTAKEDSSCHAIMFSKQVVHLLVAHLSTCLSLSLSLSTSVFFPIVLEDTPPSLCHYPYLPPLFLHNLPPHFVAPSLCVATES
jgi:hypothetical protein